MKITFEFTVEEVNIILQGLSELPAKTSMLLLQKIQEEGNKQIYQQKTIAKENT
jgi:hypothetical protein